jgi:hypothetical protein
MLKTIGRMMRLFASVLVLVSPAAFGAGEDDVPVAKGAPDKARQRLYSGGRDEQDLEVQATLPQATRTADGSAYGTSEAAGADEAVDQD